MDNDFVRCELKKKIQIEVDNFLDVLNKVNEDHDEEFLCDFVMNYVAGVLINYFSWLKSDMTHDLHYEELKSVIDDVLINIKISVVNFVIPKISKNNKVSSIISNTIH